MTVSNNYFFRRITKFLRLTSALILAGCALWMGHRVAVNYAMTGAPANPLPNLRGHAAVEHLKQEGLYNTLAERARRYNADTTPSGCHYDDLTDAPGAHGAVARRGGSVVNPKGPGHVVYMGDDRHLHKLLAAASGWHHNDLTAATGAQLAIGNLVGYMFDAQGTQHVFYRGDDGH